MDVYLKVRNATGLRDRMGTPVRVYQTTHKRSIDAILAAAHFIETWDINETEYAVTYRVKLEVVGDVLHGVFTCVLSKDNLGFAMYSLVDERTREPLLLLSM